MPATDSATPKLNEALAAVQADLPSIPKNAKASIPGREGRQGYAYDYADLTDVSAAILPLLGKNGLAFTTWPTLDQDRFVLAYALIHESGEERTGCYPLPSQGRPQDIGSAITYARRYCLCAVTGIAPGGEDDDGAAAQHQEVHMDRPRQQAPGADMWDEVRAEERPGSAGPADLRAIQAAYIKLGFDTRTDRQEVQGVSGQLVGRDLNGPVKGLSHKNLRFAEAKQLRAELEGFKGDRGALMERLTTIAEAEAAVAGQEMAETTQEAGP